MIDPRYRKRRTRRGSPSLALACSALLHLLVVAGLALRPTPPRATPEAEPVMAVEYYPDVASIPGAHLLEPRDFVVPLAPTPEEEVAEEADPEHKAPARGQVVEVPKPPRSERPDEADYLAEHDSKVEQEMASEKFRLNSPVLSQRYSPTDAPGIEGTGREDVDKPADGADATGAERMASRTPGDAASPTPFQGQPVPSTGAGQDRDASSERGRMSYVPDLSSKYDLGRPESSSGHMGQLGGPGPSGAEGGQAAAQRGWGQPQGSPSNDYLKDEAKGDSTTLNTHEFRYAAFLNRVKRLVSFYADQTLNNAVPRQAPNKASYDVVMHAMLNKEGRLEAIRVVESSGIPEFDEALAQAFRLAAPFPNPPAGMVESDGSVHIRDFGFHIEIGRARAQMNGIDPRQGVMFPGLQTSPR
ncbi:TonB family protein [Myxococcota bacterium]|nr:TonB family protein [Myxococcota bacterium]